MNRSQNHNGEIMSTGNHRGVWTRAGMRVLRLKNEWQGKDFIHFLHLGKTGGSAVKYALKSCPKRTGFVLYLHPHRVRLRDIPRGDKVFFFLRDPVSRFVSGFYSRKRQGRPRYDSPWSPAEREAFKYFQTPDQLGRALASRDGLESRRAEAAMNAIHHVRDSYWKWFESKEYLLSRLQDILFIGFQERLNRDFQRLKTILGLDGSDTRLPVDNFYAHRNPQHLNQPLSPVAVSRLREWYACDYQLMTLCRRLVEGGPGRVASGEKR
jgi:hypothetical protein